ncbi:hypothetical protein GQI50_004488 [Salmonella enterica]|nr:hypothetical protein [Salmonella enterica]
MNKTKGCLIANFATVPSLLSSRITLPRGFFFTSIIGIMKALLMYMLKQ